MKKRYAKDLRDAPKPTSDFLSRGTAAAELQREAASTSAAVVEPVEPAFVPRKRKRGKKRTTEEVDAADGAEDAAPAVPMHPDRAARLGRSVPQPARPTAAELRAAERARSEAERVAWNKRTARGAPDISSRMNVLLCAFVLASTLLTLPARIERTLESEKAEQRK